ncbi:glycosyltransferase family 9 protein [Basilea psittacipulmonis]|uniref:Heptosyltransferase n=1 Tax=Basilea psittacipulmonis DSM 24701 TaxID=1072685 RepID=A0A077DDE9_9BURK|nr:glycosyltransferase family 9 protein [Basilea psittacipulmonis]AIL32875.1 hypothetical protein IX83_05680 [Basilea psittacipulmonis DSM 24701]
MRKIRQALGRIRRSIGKFLLDKKVSPYTSSTPPQLKTIKKIVFLRQDGKIGDYIVSSFVFREIKKQSPDTHITVVATRALADLLEANPYIDEIYYVKRRHIWDLLKCGWYLSRQQIDAVIDLTHVINNRGLCLLRLIKAKVYVGSRKSHYKIFDISIDEACHFSELYIKAVESLGFKVVDRHYDIPAHAQSAQNVQNFLKVHSYQSYTAINFYGSSRHRKFGDKKIRELLAYLSQVIPNVKICLLSSPAMNEHLTTIAQSFEQTFVYPTQSIYDSIELIRNARLLISVDTATVHIACGLNKPIIAFYNHDDVNFKSWHPNCPDNAHVIRYVDNVDEIQPEQIQKEWLVS